LLSPLPAGKGVTTPSLVGREGTAEGFFYPLPAAFALALAVDLRTMERGDRLVLDGANTGLRADAGGAARDEQASARLAQAALFEEALLGALRERFAELRSAAK